MSNSLFQNAASACQSSPAFDIVSPLQPSLQLSLSPSSAWIELSRENAAFRCARPGSGSPANMTLEYDSAFKQFQLVGLVFKSRNPDTQNTPPVFMLDGLRLTLEDTSTSVLFDSSSVVVRQNATNHQLSVTNSEDFGVCIACFKFTRQDAAALPAASSSSSDSLPASPSSTPAGPAPGSASLDPASSNPTRSSTNNLSGPVKGVIIALTLAIFAALALLLFALLRRRRQRRQRLTPNVIVGGKADLDAYDGYIEMDTPVNSTPPPRRTARHFASFSQSSVSTIPQPPPSEEPPSSGRGSVVRQLTSATLERLRSLRREGLRRDHELNRRPVLRVANA